MGTVLSKCVGAGAALALALLVRGTESVGLYCTLPTREAQIQGHCP
jgi:hypothetical protein